MQQFRRPNISFMAPDKAERPPAEHPRAKALRITYSGVALLFLLGSIVVALAAHSLSVGVGTLSLLSVGVVLGILFSEAADLLPRGSALTASERRLLLVGVCTVPLVALGSLIAVATTSLAAALLLVPATLGILLAVMALAIAWR
jgi:hypothetical protein